jgi:hypothetical protein
MATLTKKQIQTRKVIQTLYIPLQIAIAIDDESKRLGVSRSMLINRFIVEGLNNKNLQGLKNQGANPIASQATHTINNDTGGSAHR